MRLLTRSDFDGLTSAVLLKELDMIKDVKFVHPKDMQDGVVEVTKDDVLVNVPYVKGCGMWFDHHATEDNDGMPKEFKGSFAVEKSCCRVIYNHYDGDKGKLSRFKEMVEFADKCDTADFTIDEVMEPKGWVMLSFIMDPRSGFGRWKDFRISNYQLMNDLIDQLREENITQIMDSFDLKERTNLYKEHESLFLNMITKNSEVYDKILVTDLRDKKEQDMYVGNRHLPYAIYDKTNISIRIMDGKDKMNTVFSVGYSVINKTATANVGEIMAYFGGGGHKQVGTCQVDNNKADAVLEEMVEMINKGQSPLTQ